MPESLACDFIFISLVVGSVRVNDPRGAQGVLNPLTLSSRGVRLRRRHVLERLCKTLLEGAPPPRSSSSCLQPRGGCPPRSSTRSQAWGGCPPPAATGANLTKGGGTPPMIVEQLFWGVVGNRYSSNRVGAKGGCPPPAAPGLRVGWGGFPPTRTQQQQSNPGWGGCT